MFRSKKNVSEEIEIDIENIENKEISKDPLAQYLHSNKKLFEIENLTKIFEANIKALFSSNDESKAAQIEMLNGYKNNINDGDLVNRQIFIDFLKTTFLKDFVLYDILDDGSVSQKPLCDVPIIKYNNIVDWVLPFDRTERLTAREKFEIILYKYKEINTLGYDKAFFKFKEKHQVFKKEVIHVDGFSNKWYEYTSQDIDEIYLEEAFSLNFNEKIDIIIQRMFEELYGLKQIDILAYSAIEEVGFQTTGNGSYIFSWCDQKIRLSFLELTEQEAEIIQRKITKYHKKGSQLDTNNTEISTHRKDKARITVTQEPFSSNRVLRLRIFSRSDNTFEDIVTEPKLRVLIKTLIKIGFTIAIQGELGAGKSTMMSILFELLDDKEHIVTVEDVLEQYNSLKYKNKSIVELQSTDKKTLLDALNTLLRLSADVAALGEARDGEALFILIQLAQAIGKTVLFTTHMASPDDYIPRGKNMLISTGKYFTEQAAVFDLVHYTNIIFQLESIDDKRYISKIVEIVPLVNKSAAKEINLNTSIEELQKMAYIQQIQQNPSNMYRLNTLIELEEGKYKFKNLPSEKMRNRANKNKETRKYFEDLIHFMDKDLDKGVC